MKIKGVAKVEFEIRFQERRIRAVREIVRLLRHGGRALIYAWARDQEGKEAETDAASYLRKNNMREMGKVAKCDTDFKLALPVHENRTNFRHADLLVPWKTNKKKQQEEENQHQTFHRYYHVFESEELKTMILDAVGCEVEIEDYYYDQGNWCAVMQKRKL